MSDIAGGITLVFLGLAAVYRCWGPFPRWLEDLVYPGADEDGA